MVMVIEFRNLTYTYPQGTEPAVKGIDFAVEKGEIFGFLGPSGAGKSTTQKVLIKLLRGYQGDIKVFGQDLNKLDSRYYEKVGVAFELPNHYQKLTALENLNLFASLYSGKTQDPMHLLEMVGLKDDANTRVSQFSKGMQMRLNFIRSMLHQPELLFLDEPTTGLDPVNGRKIKEIVLEQKAAGKTVFLTTHDMVVAEQLCDRVAFIVDGRIDLIDSPRSLKLQHGQRTLRVEYSLNGSGDKISEFPLDGLAENANFMQVLREGRVETIHTQEATLEEIFIKTTGRRLV
jgi:fluoroquinolone transport system ATP-binding protein